VFLAPTMFGFWFPARHLVPALPLMVPLVAIGLRHMPRLGIVLGAIGVVASVWLYVDVRSGDGFLATGRPNAPWGPLEVVWPPFGDRVWPDVLAAFVFAAVAAAFFVDARVWRRLAGRARVGAGASALLVLVAFAGLSLFAPGVSRAERVRIGESREGRAIVASRLGDPSSPRKVLVVGMIHGDEPAGLRVARDLRRAWGPRLRGVDLWVVDTFNPDGRARGRRQNARGVDLNRNFPFRWRANGRRGSRYWGGPKPLSEPESRAVQRLVLQLRPAVTIWYHQPWGAVLACGRGALNAVPRHYARLSGMPTSCRGRDLTGTATSWQNNDVGGGSAFVVELPGGRVSDGLVRRNARAAALVAQGR
jgi:murein peptide amidase A